jgi:hypothetical protein
LILNLPLLGWNANKYGLSARSATQASFVLLTKAPTGSSTTHISLTQPRSSES